MVISNITHEELASKRPPTVAEGGQRKWLYPDRRGGKVALQRKWIAMVLIAIYLVTPWIMISGRPLVRIDVIHNVTYFFGLVLRMTEINYIFFLFASLAIILFLSTTLRGRIWCGYACPQTVFVDWVIRPIEELIEGKAAHRRTEDAKPMTPFKLLRKVFKHVVFLLITLIVTNSLLGYFVDPKVLLKWVFSPPAEHPMAFGIVSILTGLMYFDLSWFREQFCSFICPYARFQSALLDSDSPSFTYDVKRGEPRGRGKSKGDCIDCGLCVRVCPTGIDIRNGLQLECIQCGRCADACDSVMGNLKRPLGLVRFISEKKLLGDALPPWRRIRVIFYTVVLIIVMVGGIYTLVNRPQTTLTFLRQKGAAFSRMPDGQIGNIYEMRVVNNTGEPKKVILEVLEPKGITIICPNCNESIGPYDEKVAPFILRVPPGLNTKNVLMMDKVNQREILLPLLLPGKL